MDGARPALGSSAERLRHLYRFMAIRHFVAGRSELKRAGFSATWIDSWLRTGRLIRLFRSVYAYGREVETRASVWRGALLVAGPDSALTGRTGCEAWGMVRPRPGIPVEVEVGSPTGQAKRLRGWSPALARTTVKVVKRNFEPDGVRIRDGLQLATPPLALIDFAAGASERQVRFAFLEACRLKLLSRRDLNFCFTRLAGRRGAKKLRPLLSLWVPELGRIKSVLEGWFLLTWREHGHPMPEINARIHGYEVDVFWPSSGIVLELDGGAFHGDPVQRRLDRQKQRDLEARGLTVVRITYRQFEYDPPGNVARVARSIEHARLKLSVK